MPAADAFATAFAGAARDRPPHPLLDPHQAPREAWALRMRMYTDPEDPVIWETLRACLDELYEVVPDKVRHPDPEAWPADPTDLFWLSRRIAYGSATAPQRVLSEWAKARYPRWRSPAAVTCLAACDLYPHHTRHQLAIELARGHHLSAVYLTSRELMSGQPRPSDERCGPESGAIGPASGLTYLLSAATIADPHRALRGALGERRYTKLVDWRGELTFAQLKRWGIEFSDGMYHNMWWSLFNSHDPAKASVPENFIDDARDELLAWLESYDS